jgi:hypothetical protein
MGGFKVYRASFIHDNEERINLKSGYSYPPPSLTELGRCNLKGHPVFYCTPSFLGAIYEAILTRNDVNVLKEYDYFMYVSEWELSEKKNYHVYDTNFTVPLTSENEEDFFRTIYQLMINKIFTSKLGHDISANLSFNLMGFKREATEFLTFPEPTFGENCKFIIYPTVVKDGKFPNFAIHPSIIDKIELKFNKVIKVLIPHFIDFERLTKMEPMPFVYLEVGTLMNNDGDEIRWRDYYKP